jgi:DNA-binding NarL/FixJ family response regulator
MYILLVEDHPKCRDQVADILQMKIAGIESIRTAASVGVAAEQIDGGHPPDLLVTDTQIQHGSCVDVLCNVVQFDFAVVCMSSDERDYRVKVIITAGFPFIVSSMIFRS